MTLATRASSSVGGGWTATQAADAIRDLFVTLGCTGVDSYTSTDQYRVVSWEMDAAKTKGTAYLQVRVSSAGAITATLYDSWNAGTHTGTNASNAKAAGTIPTTNPLALEGFSHPEIKEVHVKGSSVKATVALYRPATKLLAAWDEDAYLYCFLVAESNTSPFANAYYCSTTTAANPFSQGTASSAVLLAVGGGTWGAGTNTVTGKRDVLPGLVLAYGAGNALVARASDDLVWGATGGLEVGDLLQVTAGSEEYAVLHVYSQAGPLVRVV
jgi:hypothetical protein